MGNSSSISQVEDNLPPDFPKDIVFFHLANLTNTCYCNSVLQAFLFSYNITHYFASLNEITFPKELTNSPLYNFLQIFVQKLEYEHFLIDKNQSTENNKKKPIPRDIFVRPSAFLESIYSSTSQFVRNQQNDSHEFLLYLISSFDDTISQLKKIYEKQETNRTLAQPNVKANSENSNAETNADHQKDNPNNENNSLENQNNSNNSNISNLVKKIKLIPPFSLLFEGTRSSSFECAFCHHIQEKLEKFSYLDIGIPLDNQGKELDIQRLIDFSLDPDNISAEEGGWVCSGCSKKGVNVEITSYIKDIPPTLLIQLQRFKYSKQTHIMEKINRFVKIQNEIHLNSGSGPQQYKLKTMICHIGGSLYQGHFVAILRVDHSNQNSTENDNLFILASDSNLKLIDQKTVDSLIRGTNGYSYTPYVLLYEVEN